MNAVLEYLEVNKYRLEVGISFIAECFQNTKSNLSDFTLHISFVTWTLTYTGSPLSH